MAIRLLAFLCLSRTQIARRIFCEAPHAFLFDQACYIPGIAGSTPGPSSSRFVFHNPELFSLRSELSVSSIQYPVSSMTSMTSHFSKCWHAALPILLILGSGGSRAEAASTYNLDTKLAGPTFFDNFDFYTVSKQSRYVTVAIFVSHPLKRKLNFDQGQ